VDSHAVRTGKLPPDQWRRLSEQTGRLAKAPIFIDDSASLTMMEIRAKARRLKAEHDVQMIILDYLQLVKGHRAESRQQEITEISRSLKALAKELRIPVLALSQLSRAVETRGGNHRPQLSDLRESGAIEQDADVVMFIYRDVIYKRRQEEEMTLEDERKAEIIVAKQRNGPTDTVRVVFIDTYARFENLARKRDEMAGVPF
ncbi:MAG: DnaB-like helicase C-terminal domain-containing protein, partial [Candidatus Marinimicrobia bacterium]|nr:DnaB-like helicase C-terminal domain-containing protein [Candidatus Neomarinimicrobiota bacterium]